MMNPDGDLQRDLLKHCEDLRARIAPYTNRLLSATDGELSGILDLLAQRVRDGSVRSDAAYWEELFSVLHAWQLRGAQENRESLSDELREKITALYQQLGETCPARFRLLQWLTMAGGPDDLKAFATALCDDPPETANGAALPFVPLLSPHTKALALFPKIKHCLSNPLLAAPIVDLGNFLTRSGLANQHPLAADRTQLIRILAGATRELEALQSEPGQDQTAREHALAGVSLAVSLCDALALIGDDSAIATLSHALELQHRRLHVEAAAALTRLGDEAGKQALFLCAADPVTRLRALKYAEELGLDNQVDEAYRSPIAVAEAELVSYLAEPSVMGLPPSSCELVDSQTMYWPGYEEPRQCFLFRFAYGALVDEQYVTFSNIGIAGPVVHVFKADLGNLPVDDIYAAFAGWQAEHPEITQSAVGQATGFGGATEQLVERLESHDFHRVQPVIIGRFFGEDVIAAAAIRQGVAGALVADRETTLWYPAEATHRPITPAEAYCIYKGRRLLRQFN